MSDHDVKRITEDLAEPFDPKEVKWKAQTVKGNRAMAVAFIDARVVQDRLDEVLGVEGWQDEYELLPEGSVVCRLRCKLGGEWLSKMDVGSPSEQPDGGDRVKAAFSDSLKRAAVKFGIGRYIYRLPTQWVDYDPQKRQFTQTPKLPAFALPHARTTRPSAPPATETPAVDPDESADPTLLVKIHDRIAKNDRTWIAALKFVGIDGEAPESWVEPETAQQAGEQSSWMRQADALRIWEALTKPPKSKPLPPQPEPAGAAAPKS